MAIVNLNKGHPGGNGIWMIDEDFTVDQISSILGPEDRVGAMVVNKSMSETYVRNTTGWVPVVVGGGSSTYTAGKGIEINSGVIKTKVDDNTIKFNSQGQMYAVGGGSGDVFMATYGTTTYANIKTAYDAGKYIYVYVPGTSDEPEHYAGLGKFYEATGTFFFPTTTYEGYLVQYACNENTGWTNENQLVQSKLTAGTGIRISDDNVISTTGGSDNLFKAVYSETLYADVYQAIQDGKLVYMIHDGSTYTVASCTTTTITFITINTDKFIYYATLTPMYVGANDNGWSDISKRKLAYTAGAGIKIEDNVISATDTSGSIVWAEYDTTTYDEIETAFNNGQLVLCKYNDIIYKCDALGAYSSAYFSTSIWGQTESGDDAVIREIALEDGTWNERTKVSVQPKMSAGSGIDITNNVISVTSSDSKVELITHGDSSTYATIKAYIDAGKIVFCLVNNYESSGYNLLLRVDWWNDTTIQFTNTAYGGATTWSNAVQFRCNLTSSGWGTVGMIHIGAEMEESNKIKELEERIAQLEELLN